MAKKRFNVDKYVMEICNEIGANPNDELMDKSPCPDDYLPLTYDMLIRFALMNNWDPVYHKDSDSILSEENELNKILNDYDLAPGVPPKDHMIKFLRFAAKSFNSGFFVTNFVYASLLDEIINNIPKNSSPVTLIGEEGVGKMPFSRLIHNQTRGDNNPFITVDCSAYSDDDLCSLVFGTDIEGNYGIQGTKLASAAGGSLYIKNLQSSGKRFQVRLYDFFTKDHILNSKESEFENTQVKIICSYEVDSEGDNDKLAISLDSRLIYSNFCHRINLLPFDQVRSDLPLLIFILMVKLAPRMGLDFFSLEIPEFLLRYWVLYKKWADNYHKLRYTITSFLEYYTKFKIDKRKNAVLPLYKYRKNLSCDESESPRMRYDKPDAHENMEIFFYIFSVERPEIIPYLEQLSFYPSNPIFLFDLMSIPFLGYISKLKNPKDHNPFAELPDYLKFSPFHTNISFTRDDMNKLNTDVKKIFVKSESSTIARYHKSDINKIVVEVFEGRQDLPRIKFFPKGESDYKEIKYNPKNQLPQISFLLFLIYERSNINEDGHAKNVEWGLNWLEKPNDSNFKPLINICRWMKFVDERGNIKPPSWWQSPSNTYPMITKIRNILMANDIGKNFIKPDSFSGKKAVYHIDEGIRAEIIIK
jgi:hypothetical protein